MKRSSLHVVNAVEGSHDHVAVPLGPDLRVAHYNQVLG
jgi:hypothetical protein